MTKHVDICPVCGVEEWEPCGVGSPDYSQVACTGCGVIRRRPKDGSE